MRLSQQRLPVVAGATAGVHVVDPHAIGMGPPSGPGPGPPPQLQPIAKTSAPTISAALRNRRVRRTPRTPIVPRSASRPIGKLLLLLGTWQPQVLDPLGSGRPRMSA